MRGTCPHCGLPVEVGHYVSGDRVWHTICDGWFLITFAPGGVQLTKCEPPASWPKAKI